MQEKDMWGWLPWRRKPDTINYRSEEVPVEQVLRGVVISRGSGFEGSPRVKRGVAHVYGPEAKLEGEHTDLGLRQGDVFVGTKLGIDTVDQVLETSTAAIVETHALLSHVGVVMRERDFTFILARGATFRLDTGDSIFVTESGVVYRTRK